MNAVKISNAFEVKERRIEQYPGEGKRHFTYYKSPSIIHDSQFEKAIGKLGGEVYNTCCSNIGETTLFNGFTWVGIHSTSYDDCDNWMKKFSEALKGAGWSEVEMKEDIDH